MTIGQKVSIMKNVESRYASLFRNTKFLLIGNFASKFLNVILLPLYTNVLSTSEYGIYDFFYTTICLLNPILTQNIVEGIFRFSIKEDIDDEAVIVCGIKYIFRSIFIFGIILLVNYFFCMSPVIKVYTIYVLLMYIVTVISQTLIAIAKGYENVVDISVSGVLATVTVLIGNIIFLLYFKWGLKGYLIANILGVFAQIVFLSCSIKIWKIYKFRRVPDIEKKMIDYSRPMIINSLSWWVNNASDRYVVILFWGLSANGIYSAASKIPQILTGIQAIFGQAWTISAVKNFDNTDSDGFFSKTYSIYNFLLVIVCSLVISANKCIAFYLYGSEFYSGWKYVPFLLIAMLFNALSAYIGSIFAAAMNSKIYAKSTAVGAVANIVLNFMFIPIIGTLGASISTAISFFLVWLIRIINIKKIMVLKLDFFKQAVCYLVIILQSIMGVFFDNKFGIWEVNFISFVILIFVNKDIVKSIIKNKINLEETGC